MKKLAFALLLASSSIAAQELDFPTGYREWIHLTTGMDMSYNPTLMSMGHHMFDNVYVEPSAYHAFLETGTWPDKTRLVLEGREGRTEGSINKAGMYQSGKPMAVEVHMKDAKLPGGWGFFAYGGDTDPAPLLPQDTECYACHRKDAAVDTTFVQFYPTLLPIAKSKGTLSASYKP
jgi:hypothetical protein